MIYTESYIENLYIQKAANKWLEEKSITPSEYALIFQKYPTPYQEHHFIYRSGLFLLTLFVISSSIGFMNLLLGFIEGIATIIIQSLLWCGLIYFILRHFCKTLYHYHSGLTAALSYSSLAAGYVALYFFLDSYSEMSILKCLILATPLLLFGAIHFFDKLLFVFAFAALTAILFLSLLKIEFWGQALMPFVLMAFSAGSYRILLRILAEKKWQLYHSSFQVLSILCLLLFYLAGNYYVVRELSNMLNPGLTAVSPEISLSWFFKGITLLIPLLYIYHGLKSKNRNFFQLGAVLLALGILSLKYYYSLLPLEFALTLAGFLCLGFCFWLIRFLKTPRGGVSLSQEDVKNKRGWQQISAIFIAQQLPTTIAAEPEHFTFKGGDFGGGGAGGDF